MRKTTLLAIVALPLLGGMQMLQSIDINIGIPQLRYGAGTSTLVQDLVAYWNLDELSGTRAKIAGSCGSCDLTAVNSPLANGGAGGYGLYSETTGNKALLNSTATELQVGVTNASSAWTMASWTKPVSSTASYIYGNYNGGGSSCSFAVYYSAGFYVLQTFQLTTCGSAESSSASDPNAAAALGTRNLVVTSYDPSVTANGTAYLFVNAGSEISFAKGSGGGTGAGSSLGIGRAAIASTMFTGTNDSAMLWTGRKLSTSDITALYNSGLGYQCSTLPSSLRTSLTACWDLDEASGTRAASTSAGASCTTNCDMTAVNAPGRAAGLVQNSMGMSANLISTSSQSLKTAGDIGYSATVTLNAWVNPADVTGNKFIITKDQTSNREFSIYVAGTTMNVECHGMNPNPTNGSKGSALTIGAWSMLTGICESGVGSTAYVNGSAGTLAGGTGSIADGAAPIQIGTRLTATEFMTGAMDATGIWGRKLTSSEITALYASGAGVEYPWSSIVWFLDPNKSQAPWAFLDIPTKQKVIYLKTGVYVPKELFPSSRVMVVN